MTYEELLELDIMDLIGLDPGEFCEDCKNGDVPINLSFSGFDPVIFWHPDTGEEIERLHMGYHGCNAFRIWAMKKGQGVLLQMFDQTVRKTDP